MKVLPFKILKTREQNLLFQEDRDMILYELLHQHEEVQISIIEKETVNLLCPDRRDFLPITDIEPVIRQEKG